MADLEPVKGHEQGRTRPVLIISNDVFNNGPATLVIIVPITKRNRKIPFHVELKPPEGGLAYTSYILCDHIRAISKKDRLIRKLGAVTQNTIDKMSDRLKILMDL